MSLLTCDAYIATLPRLLVATRTGDSRQPPCSTDRIVDVIFWPDLASKYTDDPWDRRRGAAILL